MRFAPKSCVLPGNRAFCPETEGLWSFGASLVRDLDPRSGTERSGVKRSGSRSRTRLAEKRNKSGVEGAKRTIFGSKTHDFGAKRTIFERSGVQNVRKYE